MVSDIFKPRVCQSNALIRAQYKLSGRVPQLVFRKAIERLDPKGDSLSATFNAIDFRKELNNDDPRATKVIMEAVNECNYVCLTIPKQDGEIHCRLFHYVELDYKTRDVTVHFAEPLRDQLLNLKERYTSYDFDEIKDLKSEHYIRLYELLRSMCKIGHYQVGIEEFCAILGLPCTYHHYGNLNQRILEPGIKDINENTSLDIKHNSLKTGRKVTKLSFVIKGNKKAVKPPQIATEPPEIDNLMAPPPKKIPKSTKGLLELVDHYKKTFNINHCELTAKRKNLFSEAIGKYGFKPCIEAITKLKEQSEVNEWLRTNANIDFLFSKPENTEKFLPKQKKKKNQPNDEEFFKALEGQRG